MARLSYQSSGVDLNLYGQAMQKLPALMQRTGTPGVMELTGGFAGLFRLSAMRPWTDPVLVSGTDGVGTKIKLAIRMQKFDTIGRDLVAMCVNDCLCLGAVPLFFLDYIAMGRDNPELLEQLVRGVSDGCLDARAALLGGETAIMPDLYADGDFDMAGFCVAAAERSELISGKERIRAGDVLIGVPSSGFHSNGYSLIRKAVFEHAGLSADDTISGTGAAVGQTLLTPTRIYASVVAALQTAVNNEFIHGIAHITGGGLCENLSRILPSGVRAEIRRDSWVPAPMFGWLQSLGDIADDEMFRVFNMGIGLVVAVHPDQADTALQVCSAPDYPAVVLGTVIPTQPDDGAEAVLV